VAKFRVKKNEIEALRKQIKQRFIKEASKTMPKILKKQIINESILKGKSPVLGEGRYAKYSTSYRNQIKGKVTFRNINGVNVPIKSGNILKKDKSKFRQKKVTPVNLKLSGKLLKSFKVKRIVNGFNILFSDAIALFHQDGTNKMPKRKMLPQEGESFNRRITRAINTDLARALKKVLPKSKVKKFL